jgi:hypothetical protein
MPSALWSGRPADTELVELSRGRGLRVADAIAIVAASRGTMARMSELSDTVSDAVDKAQEEGPGGGVGGASLNSLVAVSVAVVATFIALCNVKDGNIVQAMQQAQANGVDEWAYFQAKGTKLNIAESARDGLVLQREMSGAQLSAEARALIDKKIADYDGKISLYEQEKAEIKKKAGGFQEEYDRLNVHDDQFDMAEALTSVAIALLGITALTRKRRLLYVAWAFAAFGVVLGIAGFAGLNLHPDFLARFLG